MVRSGRHEKDELRCFTRRSVQRMQHAQINLQESSKLRDGAPIWFSKGNPK